MIFAHYNTGKMFESNIIRPRQKCLGFCDEKMLKRPGKSPQNQLHIINVKQS